MKPSDLAFAIEFRAELATGSARARRLEAKVSLSDAARALGVSHQRVSGWERGKAVPSAEHALAYGRLLARLGKAA
ncbi:MAG TPA: helix-turn-helix transcriptional regulator [Trebonia sp.]